MKKIIRVALFLLIGAIIFWVLTIIFVPKWIGKIDPATPRIKGFYLEEKNTIDVLAVGNSDVGRGFSPITLWNNYGITSYNLGTSNQTMLLAYYVIKEATEYQDIKTVVLDMDATFVEKNAPEGEYRKLFDNMRWGKTKIEALNETDLEIDNKLSYVFPLIRFHSRWNELEDNDFYITKKYNKSTAYKGMAMSSEVKPYVDKKEYMKDTGEVARISEKNQLYIKKIVDLCREKNIELLWIEMPSATSWSSARSKAVQELAKQYEIEFIDMNYPIPGLDFDWESDTADGGNHLNISGAEKVSNYVGKVLQEKYHLEDHRQDPKYASWYDEAKRYEKNKQLEQMNAKGK